MAASWAYHAIEDFNNGPEIEKAARDLRVERFDAEIEGLTRLGQKYQRQRAELVAWYTSIGDSSIKITILEGDHIHSGFSPRVEVGAAATLVDNSGSPDLGDTWISAPLSRYAEGHLALTPEWRVRTDLDEFYHWGFWRLYLHGARDIGVLPTEGELDNRALLYSEWRVGLAWRVTYQHSRSLELSAGIRTNEQSATYMGLSPWRKGTLDASNVYGVAPKGPLSSQGAHGYYAGWRVSKPVGDAKASQIPGGWDLRWYWGLRLSDEPTRSTNERYTLTVGESTALAALPEAGALRATFSLGLSVAGW